MKDKQCFKNIQHIWSDDHQTCYTDTEMFQINQYNESSISNRFKCTFFFFCIQWIPIKKRGLSPLSIVIVAQNE